MLIGKLNTLRGSRSMSTGFTIVELLVVIVVIGILAAITIVSYNGVQDRAKSVSSETLAKAIQTKTQLYYAYVGTYPEDLTDFNSIPESVIDDPATVQFGGSSPTSHEAVRYAACLEIGTSRVVGYQIMYWTSSGVKSVTEGLCS